MTGLALVLGLPHEPPVAAVLGQLERLGVPHRFLDQRELAVADVSTWWEGGHAGGLVRVNPPVPLDRVTGVYTRLTSWTELPVVQESAEALTRAMSVHRALEAWLESTEARVVNRTSANDTNNSKPYQALIIREHFEVPATLVTNDPGEVHAFREEYGRIIFKSISGERSIVTEFTEADTTRLSLLGNCPVQFQELVPGVDVRVHVVGPRVFATAVDSDATDYRYGTGADMHAVALPEHVEAECRALTRRLGLEMSGIDLRFTEAGRVVCFEVNPSPAYSAYEEVTGQPLAEALARHLGGPSSGG